MFILLIWVHVIKKLILLAINGFNYHFSLMYYRHGFKGRENPNTNIYIGTIRKSMIIRNRNRGVKLVIKYNADGIYVGESSMHLTSYLGVLACTMVPIRYNTWWDVLEQLKDKVWDSIEVTYIFFFNINEYSIMSTFL